MSGLGFNEYYKILLDKLPPSIKKNIWARLTTRKNNPLSEEQASGTHPDIKFMLMREVDKYLKKKGYQRLASKECSKEAKVNTNITSDDSSALLQLDELEKQL